MNTEKTKENQDQSASAADLQNDKKNQNSQTETDQPVKTNSPDSQDSVTQAVLSNKQAIAKGARARRRNMIIAVVCGVIFFALLIWFMQSDSAAKLARIQKMIQQAGIFGPILFILISVFTSYIPIVPLGSMGSIGIVVFGPLHAFFYNTMTSYLNCILAFWLARRYGTKFILNIATPEAVEKYENLLKKSKHFELIFFIWMMMPVSPDLLLCMLAGLSTMKTSHFLLIILISRPFSSWCYSTGMLKIFQWLSFLIHV